MKLTNESKSLMTILRLCILGFFFLMLFSDFNSVTARADELYFDEDGNLYFHTRDKKASGSVRYKTVGWVIKRYDMPIDAPEQQYVIVTKRQYKPEEKDPDDSKYVYSYFCSDKEEILSAVMSVSEEWYNILTGYGDDVYIDSVMTVVEDGEEQGSVMVGGVCTGEIYYTYEGIAGARAWASPESLEAHFGYKIAFPQIVKKKDAHVDVIKREDMYFNTSRYTSFIMGAGTYGSEPYDISSGIPSGKSLYVKGMADSMQAVLKLTKVTARLTEYVEVPVSYLMRWQDYYGNYQHDNRVIYRYYEVTRDFSYYEFGDMKIYDLSAVRITGNALENGGITDTSVAVKSDMTWENVSYGDAGAHITYYDVRQTSSIGTMLLVGENGKKPTIPDTDYSEVAESFLGDVCVKNDKVVVDGVTVLSDAERVKNGSDPTVIMSAPGTQMYREGIYINESAPNGENNPCQVELIYRSEDGKTLTYTEKLGNVVVHTPVYCNGTAYTDRALNQAVVPCNADVVLGEYMTVSFNDFGMHRDIKGYGLGSYAEYVGIRQVCCPFAVEYGGTIYEPDTWITVDGHNARLRIIEENDEGEYIVYIRTQASNGLDNIQDKAIEENANLDIESYGAWDAIEVRLIGKICNLEIAYEGAVYDASQMPAQIEVNRTDTLADTFGVSFKTIGNIADNDSIEVKYSYYHEDKNGILTPVDVYGVHDRNYLDGVITGKYVEKETLRLDSCGNVEDSLNGNSIKWTTYIPMYDELLVVPQGTTAEDIKSAIASNRMADICISSGAVVVCVDIVRLKAETPYLSYINEENAKKGYCNMWLKEGGTDKYPYGAVVKIELGDDTYYDYEVSGTH